MLDDSGGVMSRRRDALCSLILGFEVGKIYSWALKDVYYYDDDGAAKFGSVYYSSGKSSRLIVMSFNV